MRYTRLISYFLVLLCVASIRTTATGQSHEPQANRETQREEDLVHFGDIIDIDVVGGFEFDWRGTLTPEGFLDGLVGFSEPVYGLCRSESQIAIDVTKLYSKILRNPNIVVKIIDRSNRAAVRLDGGVRAPARFQLRREVHLRELIVLAGGITDEASGDITIFRPKNLSCVAGDSKSTAPSDNESQITTIKIREILSGAASADPKILSGDIVTVATATPVYVIGAVNNPRPIYYRSEITLVRAIATAGGLAKEADGTKVSIIRRDGSNRNIIETDVGKIKRGESIDEVLKPFDIISVAAKSSGKRKNPPVTTASEIREKTMTNLPLRVIE